MPLSPAQRTMRSRAAAYAAHAKRDPKETTEPARRAFADRFIDQVDPLRELPEDERARRAASAMKSYMQSLALKSSRARSAKAGR